MGEVVGVTLDRLGWLRGWGVVPPSSPKALSGLGERGSGLSISATLPLGGGIPFGDTAAEANIAGLPPKTHLADGGPLMGGWYRMGLAPTRCSLWLPMPMWHPPSVGLSAWGSG